MLTSKPKKDAAHPYTRISKKTRAAFKKRCQKLGLTCADAIRQLVASYLEHPFKIHPRVRGEALDTAADAARDTQANVLAIRKVAEAYGVSHSEVLRQLIDKYLES